jgi:hypothetical protein
MPQEPIPQDPVPAPVPAPIPVPPELLAWAKQTLDVQAFLEEVRETQATGGHTFESVIAAVEAVMRSS